LFFSRLRWTEWATATSSPRISANKAFSCCLLIWISAVLLLLCQAGRGGEGDEKSSSAVDGARGRRGFFSALVYSRYTGWSPLEDAILLPWGKRARCAPVVRPPNNLRLCFLRGGCAPLPLLLAGLGGEGKESAAGVAGAAWKRWRDLSESSITAAVSEHRRTAAAILGHQKGPAALDQDLCSSFFLLQWRIFSPDSFESVSIPDAPSGLVPGGDGNDGIRRLGGGAQ